MRTLPAPCSRLRFLATACALGWALALPLASPAASQVCGDAQLQAGEQCDDGALVEGDGCSALCLCNPATTPAVCDLSGGWVTRAAGPPGLIEVREAANGQGQFEGVVGVPLRGEYSRGDSCASGNLEILGVGDFPARTYVADDCNAIRIVGDDFATLDFVRTVLPRRFDGEFRSIDFEAGVPLDPTAGAPLGGFSLDTQDAGVEEGLAAVVLGSFDGLLAGQATRRNELRNVDPTSGRPRRGHETGPCASNVFGGQRGIPGPASVDPACWLPGEALAANPATFDAVCLLSLGEHSYDASVCPERLYNSNASTSAFSPNLTVGAVLGNLFAGNPAAAGFTVSRRSIGAPPVPLPDQLLAQLVGLNADACDGFLSDCATSAQGDGEVNQPNPALIGPGRSINQVLSSQQKALLGCGEFYANNCDDDGIHLANAELGVLTQSFVGIDGDSVQFTYDPGSNGIRFDVDDPEQEDMPGTVGFLSGALLTRSLPGTRGPGDAGYDPQMDGCVGPVDFEGTPIPACASSTALLHPYTGQPFRSEMAAFSWNLQQTLVAFSTRDDDGLTAETTDFGLGTPACLVPGTPNPGDPICFDASAPLEGVDAGGAESDEFDNTQPTRLDGCSYAAPQLCLDLRQLLNDTTLELAEDPSGPPQRRWLWESGAEYAIEEAFGDLADFAGWSLHAIGPEEPRVAAQLGVGVPMLLAPPASLTTAPDSPIIQRAKGPDGFDGTEDDPFVGFVFGIADPDADRDGVPDAQDNCSQLTNPLQEDSNQDGFGNLCDADLNDDGFADFLDLGLLKARFFGSDPDADLNSDGTVDFLDLGRMKALFFQAPGPSGLGCAGSVPCP